MLVIQCKAMVKEEYMARLVESIKQQKGNGALVLPLFCEPVAEVGDDETLALTKQDGEVYFCTGCRYRDKYAEHAKNLPAPSILICPYHYIMRDGGPWIYCPNWPPMREERMV